MGVEAREVGAHCRWHQGGFGKRRVGGEEGPEFGRQTDQRQGTDPSGEVQHRQDHEDVGGQQPDGYSGSVGGLQATVEVLGAVAVGL